jgi:peptide chain release factor subunit 1
VLEIERNLAQIESFHPVRGHTLSLYLDTDPTRGSRRNLRAQIEDVLRPIRSELPDARAAAELDAATATLARELEALNPVPRAVAAFSCPESGFVQIVPLPEPVVPTAHWQPSPRLKELVAAIDEHERTIVVLVDRERARIYRVFMGQIEEVADLERSSDRGDEPGRANREARGGPRGSVTPMGHGQRSGDQRHEWHVRRHLERVLTVIRDKGSLAADRMLVGGAKDTVHELLALMPSRVRARARLISGLNAGDARAEVLARVMEAQERAEREAEEELVDNLLERDRSHSVFGPAPVMEAVSDAHVHTLVYGAGVEAAGCECDVCGWLMSGPVPDTCPRCGGPMRAVPDLVERMVHRVLESGGRIEEVRGPASRTLEYKGGVAALLRYQPSTNGHSPAGRR